MTAKIIVIVLGLALIIFVNWYFLFSRRKPRRRQGLVSRRVGRPRA